MLGQAQEITLDTVSQRNRCGGVVRGDKGDKILKVLFSDGEKPDRVVT
jgi:hypothetical protein